MLLFLSRVVFVAAVFAVPLVFATLQTESQRNFRVVEPGVLYRSGQMDLLGLKRAVHDYGIRTVISLREGGPDAPKFVRDEEHWCRSQAGLYFYGFPVKGWQAGPGEAEAPSMANLRQLRAILADPRHHPVLIHCFAGIHRTGIYCAVCRMERQGWPLDRALDEMRHCGYVEYPDHADVRGFLEGQARQLATKP